MHNTGANQSNLFIHIGKFATSNPFVLPHLAIFIEYDEARCRPDLQPLFEYGLGLAVGIAKHLDPHGLQGERVTAVTLLRENIAERELCGFGIKTNQQCTYSLQVLGIQHA
jgi:hypothetical protein